MSAKPPPDPWGVFGSPPSPSPQGPYRVDRISDQIAARNDAQTAQINAEATLAHAKAALIMEIRAGLAAANEQARSECAESYGQRVAALESLYRVVCGDGG